MVVFCFFQNAIHQRHEMFDNIYKLDGVPVATVQLRFDGWVTELNDPEKRKDVKSDYSGGRAPGMDNLLYTADAEFSCFADLALTSPSSNYYKSGEVSTDFGTCRCAVGTIAQRHYGRAR